MALVIFHRPELVKILFDGLAPEARAKIITRERVINIEQDEIGCSIDCENGTKYTGDVVIGADGVRSETRRQLRQAMLRAGKQPDCDEEQPYECSYRMLWCTFPRPTITPAGLGGETQDTDRTLAYMAGTRVSNILCYEKLPAPTKERKIYSRQEIEDFAQSFFDYPVTETMTFKELYNSKTAGMANLEEGVVKNFSYKRIVLVGDAAHRFTPNAGLGFNNGIQDIVAVCNGIHAVVHGAQDGKISTSALENVFETFFDARIDIIKKDLRGSAVLTRLQAWANTWFYILSRFLLVSDWFQRYTIRTFAAPKMSLTPVFEYIPSEEPYFGSVPWVVPMPNKAHKRG